MDKPLPKYAYDIWDDNQSQMAYLYSNIDSDQMDELMEEFIKTECKGFGTDNTDLMDSFVNWLSIHHDPDLVVLHRPNNDIHFGNLIEEYAEHLKEPDEDDEEEE